MGLFGGGKVWGVIRHTFKSAGKGVINTIDSLRFISQAIQRKKKTGGKRRTKSVIVRDSKGRYVSGRK